MPTLHISLDDKHYNHVVLKTAEHNKQCLEREDIRSVHQIGAMMLIRAIDKEMAA